MARYEELSQYDHSLWKDTRNLGNSRSTGVERILPGGLRKHILEYIRRRFGVCRKRTIIWRIFPDGSPDASFGDQGMQVVVDDDVSGHYFFEGLIEQDAEHLIVACDQVKSRSSTREYSQGPAYFLLGPSAPAPEPWGSTQFVKPGDGEVFRKVPVRIAGKGDVIVQATRDGTHEDKVPLGVFEDFGGTGGLRLMRVTAEGRETLATVHTHIGEKANLSVLSADEGTTWLIYKKGTGQNYKFFCAAWTRGIDGGTETHPEHELKRMSSIFANPNPAGPAGSCLVLGQDKSSDSRVLRFDQTGAPDASFGDQGRISSYWAEQLISEQLGAPVKRLLLLTSTYSESEKAYFLYGLAIDSDGDLLCAAIVAIDLEGKPRTQFATGGVLALAPEDVGLDQEPLGEENEWLEGLSWLVSIASVCVSKDSIYLLNSAIAQVYRVDRDSYDVRAFELAHPSKAEDIFPRTMFIDSRGRLVIGGDGLLRYRTRRFKRRTRVQRRPPKPV